jgi:hypothetical protein
LTGVDSYFPTGMTSIEMAISVAFFTAYSNATVFYFGLEAYNGLGSKGKGQNIIFGTMNILKARQIFLN